jgi:hypothetical protein
VLDIRSFSLVSGAEPLGELEFEAKILGPGGKIIAAKAFHTRSRNRYRCTCGGKGLNEAFAKAATELVQWAVDAVNSAPPEPAPPARIRQCRLSPRRRPRARQVPQAEPPAPPQPPT